MKKVGGLISVSRKPSFFIKAVVFCIAVFLFFIFLPGSAQMQERITLIEEI